MHIYADCSFMVCDFGEHGTLQVYSSLAIVNVFPRYYFHPEGYNVSLISGWGTRKCTHHFYLDSMNNIAKKIYEYN